VPRTERNPDCFQAEESIDLITFWFLVVAHEFWFNLLRGVGLQHLSPQPKEDYFDDWWEESLPVVVLNSGRTSVL